MTKIKASTFVLVSGLFLSAGLLGATLGMGLAQTKFIRDNEQFTEFRTDLPTKLLDINGELITELAGEERREIISIRQLPQHMIDALVSREDRVFYRHHGFTVKAITRAVVGKLTRRSLGGGSTLTQQIAGTLYCDRRDMSFRRKLRELWWAIQMERRHTKDEILELYLNEIYFGGGTYGVSAASKYYFGHGAEEITPAEAAILVIQLSNPTYYNPFDNPNRAMDRQEDVLRTMVAAGYITQEEADDSFNEYWGAFDYTRTSTTSAFSRNDRAPWFSEYVRRELSDMLYGTDNIYSSGFTVNTTLDLRQQQAAQETMDYYIGWANQQYQASTSARRSVAARVYTPLSELIALTFNLGSIKVTEQRNEAISRAAYTNTINPVIDVAALMFGLDRLKLTVVNRAAALAKQDASKTTIEGTMVAVQNGTGYITALVGGSKYDNDNQFIRAVQARVQPGSSFKPLYYSAAIESRTFTETTAISDTPTVFYAADGKPYIVQNFKGEYEGDVQLWYALCRSMNVPSIKVLDGIGFDRAISQAVSLLGIPERELPTRGFVPGYPIGLGVCSVRPIEIARAYAIFASGGKEITPIAIRSVEDRNGNVFLNPEKDVREAQAAKGAGIQVITPQTAFIMTDLLQNTVFNGGTLAAPSDWGRKFRFTDENGRQFTMPAGGKTGTTQNWADAWAVGFTPHLTSAFWFGFDKPGQSLGLSLTGSTLAGVAWADFMQKANEGLPYRTFERPATGLIQATVCSVSGGVLSADCGDNKVTAWYLAGTQPTEVCTLHTNSTSLRTIALQRLGRELYMAGFGSDLLIRDSEPLRYDLNIGWNEEEEPEDDEIPDGNEEPAPGYNFLLD